MENKKINEAQPTWPGCYVNSGLYLFVIFTLLCEPCYISAFGLLSEVVLLFIFYMQLARELEYHCCCYGGMQGRQDKQVQIEIYLYQKLHINR